MDNSLTPDNNLPKLDSQPIENLQSLPKIPDKNIAKNDPNPKDDVDDTKGVEDYDKLQDYIKVKYDRLSNLLYMFPNSILREINELIDANKITSARKLQTIVTDRYKGSLEIPGLTAFRAYVVVRKKKKSLLDKAKLAFNESPEEALAKAQDTVGEKSKSIYQDLTLSIENKKVLLESLIEFCNKRINTIKEIQDVDGSASYETVILGLVKEVRAITETLITLRSELKNEGEAEIRTYISDKLSTVIRSTMQAYSQIHGGDKLDLFRTALKLKLKENSLDELASTNI